VIEKVTGYGKWIKIQKEKYMQKLIGIIGGSSVNEVVYAQAEEIGYLIALQGCSLVCGGMGGVMEAACKGLKKARKMGEKGEIELQSNPGPVCIGILPQADNSRANSFVDVAICTGMGYARNCIITQTADCLIAINGGSGTLSEIAMGWQYAKPIIALESSEGWSAKLAGQSLDQRREDYILAASTPTQAVNLAINALKSQETT